MDESTVRVIDERAVGADDAHRQVIKPEAGARTHAAAGGNRKVAALVAHLTHGRENRVVDAVREVEERAIQVACKETYHRYRAFDGSVWSSRQG